MIRKDMEKRKYHAWDIEIRAGKNFKGLPKLSHSNTGLMTRYRLELLPSGLPICKVKFINPEDNAKEIECTALIDTGSEFTCLCPSLFYQLKIEEKKIHKAGTISLFGGVEEEIIQTYLLIYIPQDNWSGKREPVVIKSFNARKEYKAIIGMDLMRYGRMSYDGITRTAWIEY